VSIIEEIYDDISKKIMAFTQPVVDV
jgi:hypothetical protein